MSLEDIKRKAQEKGADRDAALAKAAQEIKERNLKKKREKLDEKKKQAKAAPKAAPAAKNVPKAKPAKGGKR